MRSGGYARMIGKIMCGNVAGFCLLPPLKGVLRMSFGLHLGWHSSAREVMGCLSLYRVGRRSGEKRAHARWRKLLCLGLARRDRVVVSWRSYLPWEMARRLLGYTPSQRYCFFFGCVGAKM